MTDNNFTRFVKKALVNIGLKPLKLFPLRKNRVMLINQLSFQYSDNPKAVGEYLISEYPGQFQLFLAVTDVEKNRGLRDKGITPVRYLSFSYFFYSVTAKVFVTNAGGYSFLPYRKKQVVINTWHGGGAYKKGGLHVRDNTPSYIKEVKMLAKRTSYFLTTCSRQSSAFESAYMIPSERILEIGMPRNDIFFRDMSDCVLKIRRQLGLDDDTHLVLYSPTFRHKDDNHLAANIAGDYDLDVELLCSSLHERFGGKWQFAYRLHPTIAQRGVPQFEKYMNLSDYKDMQDLLLVADVLINDYSSAMWDFAFSGRPCFIFATDVRHYMETTDWYTPIEEWPFPLAQSNEELRSNILNFDKAAYSARVKQHQDALGCCENGNATQTTGELIHKICFDK